MLLWLLGCKVPVQQAALLSGWDYGWETLSHRISLLDVGVEKHALDLGFIGGPYSTGVSGSDTPLYRMRVEKVSSPDLWFLEGETDLLLTEGMETVTGTATLDGSGFPEVDGMVAVLRGFRIETDGEQPAEYPLDTYDPSYGYTTAGFGFSLGAPTGSSQIQIPVSATVRWRPQDREDMNAAIPFAHTRLTIRYTLIGYKGELQKQDISDERLFPVENPEAQSWSWTEQSPLSGTVEFHGDRASTVVGWTAFDLGVNLSGDFAGTGDYVRELGLEVAPTADEVGAWRGQTTATVETTSAIELTELTASYSATLVRIGVEEATVEHLLVEGSHPVGEAVTDDIY